MSEPFVDTDVLVQLLTGDDAEQQVRANALFNRVQLGEITLAAPVTVIADAVYVLGSSRLYRFPRVEVRDLLAALAELPHFRVEHKREVLDALDIYAATNLDFGDAMIAATMRRAGSMVVFSYDTGYDRVRDIRREAP